MPHYQQLLNAEIADIINLFPSAITIYKSVAKNKDGLTDYQCIYVNKHALELFQISENDFLNKTIFENFPLVNKGETYQKIEDVIQNNSTLSFEYKRVDKDEWWQISLSKYQNGFISSTIDITEKKINEVQLKQANELLLLTNFEVDLKTGNVFCEDLFFTKTIERPRFQLTITNIIENLLASDLKEETYNDIDKIARDDEWHQLTKKLITKNGTTKYIEVYAKRKTENNECVGIYGTIRDITEKKNQEIELEKKDKRLSESMKMLKMSNYEIDLIHNKVTYEIEYFTHVLEEPSHTILNVAEMVEYVADEDKSAVILSIENSIDDGRWTNLEYKINLKNGTSKYLECTLKSVFENGTCIKLFGTVRDITERKLYELTLIEKQYQLQLSNDLQNMGMLEYFPETNIYKISSSIKNILEEPNLNNELTVDEYYSYAYEENIEELKRKVNLAIALRKQIKVLRKLKLKNGKIKYVEIVCIPKIENNRLIKYTGTFRDITYQLNAEQYTTTNQFIISEINKTENVGTWEFIVSQNQIFLSKELNEIYEEELKEVHTVEEYFEYLYEEDRAKVASFFKENIIAKRKFDVARKIKLKNGKTKYIQIKASPILENNTLIKYVGTVTDITEKYLNDLSLQTSEARFRLFFEHNPIMYFIVNINGTILSVNNYGIQHLGYSHEELINQNVLKVFHNDDKEIAKTKLADVLTSTQNSNQWELRKVKKNGEIIWVKETAKATKDIDGNIMFLILCEDITDEVFNREFIKKKNDELIIQKNIAENLAIDKQQFASLVSHEIRTPLNAVIGITNLLLIENPLPNQIENLNTLKFSAENLMLLVNDILDLSKIESGQLQLEKIPFNLQHIVNGIHQTFLIKANEKNLEFKISFDYKIPNAIIGDPIRLMQILNNLTANAFKFTNYGNVTLSVTRQELISPSEIKIRFEVKDTGIGIGLDQQSIVFDMFSDNETSSNKKYGATGLGLNITKKLVTAFNSQIYLVSEAGVGSSFYFDIVFNIPSDTTINDENWQINFNSKRSLEGLNVLLVEDNNYNQMVMNKYMNNWKVNLDIVNNGIEALEKTKTTSDYHIILMDMHMPELNGFDTVKEIRKSKNIFWQKIPIIALTADAINFDKDDLLKNGFNDLIYKPFDPVELFKKLIQHSSIYDN